MQDVVDVIMSNIRVPEERLGDMRAQLGALSIGEQRLTALLDKYGERTVSAVIAEMRKRSETLMRAHIEAIPDGTWSFSTFVDSDGITDDILEVALDARVEGSDIHFDYSRSSPPCRGPLNSVWATTMGSTLCGMKHVFADVPINSGCFAPIHIERPHGTFLFAEYPRPVCGCAAEVSQRIMEALFGALGQAIPEQTFAGPAGTSGNFSLGGIDPETGRGYVMYQFTGGGYGGWNGGDGVSNGTSTIGISKNQPIEVLEQHFPILFETYELREGSSGAGRWRGGLGVSYKVRLLRGEAKASFMMDHGRTGPFGMLGGQAGSAQRHPGIAGRDLEPPRLRFQGRRLRAGRGGLGAGEHPGRRRLRASGGSPRRADRARRVAQVSHPRAGRGVPARERAVSGDGCDPPTTDDRRRTSPRLRDGRCGVSAQGIRRRVARRRLRCHRARPMNRGLPETRLRYGRDGRVPAIAASPASRAFGCASRIEDFARAPPGHANSPYAIE